MFAGAMKLVFWFFISRSFISSFQNFGFQKAQKVYSIQELDGVHNRTYAMLGFVAGVVIIVVGVFMILNGFGGGEIEIQFADIGAVNNVGPGVVLCLLGVAVMYYTKLPSTSTPAQTLLSKSNVVSGERFWQTTTGLITKITALVVAISGLIISFNGLQKSPESKLYGKWSIVMPKSTEPVNGLMVSFGLIKTYFENAVHRTEIIFGIPNDDDSRSRIIVAGKWSLNNNILEEISEHNIFNEYDEFNRKLKVKYPARFNDWLMWAKRKPDGIPVRFKLRKLTSKRLEVENVLGPDIFTMERLE